MIANIFGWLETTGLVFLVSFLVGYVLLLSYVAICFLLDLLRGKLK